MGLIARLLFSLLLLLAYPNFAAAAVDGCFLLENNTDFFLQENNTDFFLLQGDDGGACGGLGGPSAFSANKQTVYQRAGFDPQ